MNVKILFFVATLVFVTTLFNANLLQFSNSPEQLSHHQIIEKPLHHHQKIETPLKKVKPTKSIKTEAEKIDTLAS